MHLGNISISNKNLSETVQNPARSFEKKYFGTFGESFAWLNEKKKKEVEASKSLQSPSCGQRIEILFVRDVA